MYVCMYVCIHTQTHAHTQTHSSYCGARGIIAVTCYICVLISLQMRVLHTIHHIRDAMPLDEAVYCYICVRILLCMRARRRTRAGDGRIAPPRWCVCIHYCYICVLVLLVLHIYRGWCICIHAWWMVAVRVVRCVLCVCILQHI
jgi:hypothetical protein